jgi:hypothetical protein
VGIAHPTRILPESTHGKFLPLLEHITCQETATFINDVILAG